MRQRGSQPRLSLLRIPASPRSMAMLPAVAAVISIRLFSWRTDLCSIHAKSPVPAACTSASWQPGRSLSAKPILPPFMPKPGAGRIAACCRMSTSPARCRTTAGLRWCAACSACFARAAGIVLLTWPVRNLLMGLSETCIRRPILRATGKVLRQTHPFPVKAGPCVHWLLEPDAETANDKRKCRTYVSLV